VATDVEQTALLYFESKGLSTAQAAGIVGNLKQESSLNPNEPGGGLDQGQGARAHGGTTIEQLDGIWSELSSSELGTLHKLQQTNSPSEAARIFSEDFERPGIPDLANRERYAEEAAGGAHAITAGFSPGEIAKDLGEGPLGVGKAAGEALGEGLAGAAKGEGGGILGGIEGEFSAAEILGEWLADPLRIVKLIGGGILVFMGLHTLTTGGSRGSTNIVQGAAKGGSLKLAKRAAEAAAA